MRWEREPGELVGLFAATARRPLREQVMRFLPPLIVGLVCVLLACSPVLTLLW